MINCDKSKEMISLYIDGILNEKEKELLLEHTNSCGKCKKELDEMQQLVSLCNSLPDVELPENFKLELHNKLVEAGRKMQKGKISRVLGARYMKVLSSAAACVVVVLMVKGFVWWNSGSDTKQSENLTQITADESYDQEVADDETEQSEEVIRENSSIMSDALDKDYSAQTENKYKQKTASEDNKKDESTKFSKQPAKSSNIARGTNTAEQTYDSRAIGSSKEMGSASIAATDVDDSTGSAIDAGIQTYSRSSEVVITSTTPILEINTIQNRAKAYGVEFSNASPQGIINAGESIVHEENGQNSPNVVILVSKVKQNVYDQFIASLKTYYQKADITVGPVNKIETSERYKELKRVILDNENKIRNLESSNNTDDAKLVSELQQQVIQYKAELNGLESATYNISLTIIIKRRL